MGAAEWGIGCQVSGVTPTGDKFSGEVFSYDAAMGLAVLRTKGDIINTHDVCVLRVEGIKDLKSTPPATAPVLDPLPVVDEARCQKREAASLKAAHASAANIGVGVTQEAQDIFDALARTLPCRWEGKTISVMDEVQIAPPYKDCTGTPGGDPRAAGDASTSTHPHHSSQPAFSVDTCFKGASHHQCLTVYTTCTPRVRHG